VGWTYERKLILDDWERLKRLILQRHFNSLDFYSLGWVLRGEVDVDGLKWFQVYKCFHGTLEILRVNIVKSVIYPKLGAVFNYELIDFFNRFACFTNWKCWLITSRYSNHEKGKVERIEIVLKLYVCSVYTLSFIQSYPYFIGRILKRTLITTLLKARCKWISQIDKFSFFNLVTFHLHVL